jgi:hypothetical protein
MAADSSLTLVQMTPYRLVLKPALEFFTQKIVKFNFSAKNLAKKFCLRTMKNRQHHPKAGTHSQNLKGAATQQIFFLSLLEFLF